MTSKQTSADLDALLDQYADDIAVIAMAGRFPGADSVEQFWRNLEQGVESVTFFTREQLLQSGVDPVLLENPNFVGAEGVLEGVDKFDAEFFGYSPREAELLDPQHRIFLETMWELLERAGYSSETSKLVTGVYSGAGASSYLSRNLLSHPQFVRDVGTFKVSLATGQDFVSTRASYKLGLTGPSINVNTLCSSSSVAVHYAREALLSYQCDLALAGGVTITNAREDALFYQEGGIGSFDGHCRAFDARAAGTVAGNGIALVALRRMEDALKDGDQILGVLRATAINNDGGDKASYTAPSPEGQARVITEALEVAGINPETISYLEAHGTGTNLGDPIEVSGLTRAWRRYTDQKHFCGLGSVKTNIGHLVSAGGVASMIKTLKAMEHRTIPASLNFETPNPKIDFANSPFYVADKSRPWLPTGGDLLRAGVSSFGIGGTNAHMILEEAPAPLPSGDGRQTHSILLSAKTASALETMKANLLAHIQANPQTNLADLAFTLQTGRHSFEYRFAASVASLDELAASLAAEGKFARNNRQKNTSRDICFMFPGQGSQYAGMTRGLYESEPVFRNQVDDCASLLQPLINLDPRQLLYPAPAQQDAAQDQLRQTQYAQLGLFVTEYALAQLWLSWGVEPTTMIGHSIGEYVAACLAGVFSLEDALRIVAKRGQLMGSMPAGTMLSVPVTEAELGKYLGDNLWHSVQNAPALQVVSGTEEAIAVLADKLAQDGISATRLHTSHGFHSGLMDGALAPFADFLAGIKLESPKRPFVSNLTGQLAGDEVTKPDYWVQQLRQKVRFSDGLAGLVAADPQQFFLEVGPGQTLTQLARAQQIPAAQLAASQSSAREQEQSLQQLTLAQAGLWLAGNRLDWARYYKGQQRKRLCLPTYPFERKSYWIAAAPAGGRTFQPDMVLDAASLATPVEPVAEALLRLNLAPVGEAASLNASQWQQLVKLQEEFTSRLQTLVGAEFSVRSPGLELRLHKAEAGLQPQQSETSLPVGHARPAGAVDYVAPTTPLQQLLASHWQEVLGYAPVGLNDNFFDMGGHSLMAAALVTKARKDFAVEVPLRELLESPTIAQLSELLENRLWLLEQSQKEVKEQVVEVLEL